MNGGFGMYGEHIGPRVNECRNVFVGIGNHQMHIQRKLCGFANGFNNRWANGDIRNEMAIHHVHVNQMRSGFLDLAYFFAKGGEIRRQD